MSSAVGHRPKAKTMDARANRFMELFSTSGRERLMAHLEYLEMTPGQVIFSEGDPSDGIYLILEGIVDITKTVASHDVLVSSFEAGDFLGEVTVLDGLGRSMSALARDRASLARVPLEELLDVLDREPVSVTISLFQRVLSHLRCVTDAYVHEVVRKEKLMVVGEMAGSLMHDLRNPVQVILSSADVISMAHDDDATTICCDRVRVQCDRLVTMAGDLLEYSKGESKLRLARTDTGTLLTEFEATNENIFSHPSITVALEHDPAEIEVDAHRLQRALQNLLNNAIEAVGERQDGGGHVTVQAWVSDSVFHLAITDNGPGLPDYVQQHLFEPFVTQGKKGGTGLGMAIVHAVVTAHRGTISVETTPGEGTRFIVLLPQDAAAPALA